MIHTYSMNIQYKAYSSIPLEFNFIDYTSGAPVDIIFPQSANQSLSASVSGALKFSVFVGGTNTVAVSTLNGNPLPLSNLYAFAYSTSGNKGYYQIAEGLSGGLTNPQSYDVSAYYRKTDASGNTLSEIPVSYTFWVQ